MCPKHECSINDLVCPQCHKELVETVWFVYEALHRTRSLHVGWLRDAYLKLEDQLGPYENR